MTTYTKQQRLEALETKIAYLESAIDDLNSVVYEQSKRQDALNARLENLGAQLKELAQLSGPESPAPDSERPPHY